MQIFVSYRRQDSGYLAAALHSSLAARGATIDVFVDTRSLSLGIDFMDEVRERIARADAVVVLIGPLWRPDRLQVAGDFVHDELMAAQQHGVRVVPALHTGALPPLKGDVPERLHWLLGRNMFWFGKAADLESDVDRLFLELTGRAPELAAVRDQAWALYERQDYAALLTLAEETWADEHERPSPALAEVCRTVMISMVTTSDPRRDLWSARALTTAFRSGAANSFAAGLLPHFFRQLAEGDGPAARQVLDEMERVASIHDPSQLPSAHMVRRLVAEKRAYSFARDGLLDQAATHYEAAYAAAVEDGDTRGALKSRGGLANCLVESDPEAAARELHAVEQGAAEHLYEDVRRTAADNVVRIEASAVTRFTDLQPFEVL
jgi:hypothetical protein